MCFHFPELNVKLRLFFIYLNGRVVSGADFVEIIVFNDRFIFRRSKCFAGNQNNSPGCGTSECSIDCMDGCNVQLIYTNL